MEIVGVEINGVRYLPYVGINNSSGYFRSFMNYCIDRYFDRILMNPELNEFFSLAPNDPVFKSAITKRSVEEHNGMHYSMNNGTPEKIGIMVHISNLLTIDLFVHTW